MFTGLIQALATFKHLNESRLQVVYAQEAGGSELADVTPGDSVAVDGVCLTVVDVIHRGFVAAVSPETLQRTTLGQQQDRVVNLEAALRVGSKLGGHFVTGHVDGIGQLQSSTQTAAAWEMSFTVPETVARYIVPKGSIAINGVSLTVADCNDSGTWFKIAVIPHTFTHTTLHRLQAGCRVNLEGDVLGKYVEKFLRLGGASNPDGIGTPETLAAIDQPLELTPEFLVKHGYL